MTEETATDLSEAAGAEPAPAATSYAGPVRERERIESLDVLRGFALLGILVMNIQSFSMPSTAYLSPSSFGSLEGANGLVWLLSYLFFDMKFMAMFSMMFGAGIVLMSQHRDAAGRPVLAVHYRRMLLLLAFGLAHAYLLWYGDILVPYAICGMSVVWMRRWSPRRLAVVGAGLFIVGSFFPTLTGLGGMASPDVADTIRAEYLKDSAELDREIGAYRGAWIDHLPFRAKEALNIQVFVLPFMFFWRISGLMLIGMALYKWRVLSASRSTAFYVRMAAAGALLGLPLVAYGAWWGQQHDFDPVHVLGFGMLPNWYGSLGVAFMWMALVMLLCRAASTRPVQNLLADYGRMAFTNYIGQTVLATLVFYGYGLGLFGSLERVQQIGVVIAIWTVQLALSPLWLRHFRFGPLEWLWRSGVYMQRQPMRR